MPIQKIISKGKVPVKIYTDEVEPDAMQQLYNIAQLPNLKVTKEAIQNRTTGAIPYQHPGAGMVGRIRQSSTGRSHRGATAPRFI